MASHRAAREGYVYGTAARNVVAERERTRERRVVQYRQNMSHTVRKNQEKALQMDLPYVIMLTLAAICTLYICVCFCKVLRQCKFCSFVFVSALRLYIFSRLKVHTS